MPDIEVPLADPALVGKTIWLLDWTKTGLEVDLPCWGTPEEKERLWREVERDADEA
jgi:hypothetical protein